MTSIAERCRTRDSEDEIYSSSGSGDVDSNDDSDSMHSDQTSTNSESTNASLFNSRRRRHRSMHAGDTSDSDSDDPSTTDNDDMTLDSDESDSDNDDYFDENTTHSSSGSGTLTSTPSQQGLSQGSSEKHDVKDRATVSDTRAKIQYSKAALLSMDNKDINRPSDQRKQLWGGESAPMRSQQHDPSPQWPPSARTPTSPVEPSFNQQARVKYDDRKVLPRNRRHDGIQQQRDDRPRQQQQPPSRSDWRKQLSASSDGMAASQWTVAGIDQHLLQTANDEKSWKKKKDEERREAEWPSLHANATATTTQHQGSPQGKLKESTTTTSPPISNNTSPNERPKPRSVSQQKSGGPSSSQPDKQLGPATPTTDETNISHSTTSLPAVRLPNPPPSATTNPAIPQQTMLTTQPPTLESSPSTVKVEAPQQQSILATNVDKAQQQGNPDQVAVDMPTRKVTDGSKEPTTTLPGSNIKSQDTPSSLPPLPKVVLPPTKSPLKHGYLQKRHSTLEPIRPPTDPTTITDDAPPLSLKEHLDLFYASKQRRPTHQKCALDQAWWQPYESHEPDVEQQPDYYYTRPSLMPSNNGPSAPDSIQWTTTPTDDSSDYNRHQIPYTSPSGFHQPSSSHFGPSTNLYY
ncbi:hypothetical protein [Absidia glauca]|uniref:Uncharacterized protein n=1 Tax=Absidia glauca TaxID=4829 RepID=A0A163J3S2_ABSGL|nr:hypothetical protein [Absidia glauca]